MNEINTKIVYFVRHGEDVQGTMGLFQGADSPLTEHGEEQALFVAQRAKQLDAEVIISSPMVRAKRTAEVVAEKTDLTIEESDLIREYVAPSALIGKSRTSPEGRAYITAMIEHLDDPEWHYADEDSYYDLHDRALRILEHLLQRDEQRILVVSHAGLIRVIITAMMTEGVPNAQLTRMFMRFLKPMNTGIMVCHYKPTATRRNKWRMVAWNDHGHLANADTPEHTT